MIESDLVEEGNWPNKMHLRRTKPVREPNKHSKETGASKEKPVSSQ